MKSEKCPLLVGIWLFSADPSRTPCINFTTHWWSVCSRKVGPISFVAYGRICLFGPGDWGG